MVCVYREFVDFLDIKLTKTIIIILVPLFVLEEGFYEWEIKALRQSSVQTGTFYFSSDRQIENYRGPNPPPTI